MMTYIVHGATGAQGKPVLAALMAAGHPVVAVGRKGEHGSNDAPVVAASFDSVDDLTSAYRGAAGVFIHLPLGAEADRLRYARNVLAALTQARPARVILSTSGQIIDTPGSPLQHPDDAALPTLARGLAAIGLSYAVIAARTFLENLLLPPVVAGVRAEGVLRYPLPAKLAVSWASHLDVADVAVALFERADVTGFVAVGQHPPVTGLDLADAFAARLGRDVAYEAVTPDAFAASVAPLIGDAGAAAVRARYTAMASLPDFTVAPKQSAQHRLGAIPRTTLQWLDQRGL